MTRNKPNVLVLDDSPSVLAQAELLLGELFDVTTCTEWVDANAKAHERRPDAVVIDWQLGPFKGTYLVRAFRIFFGAQLPIVMISAHPAAKARPAATEAGADEFLSKADFEALPLLLQSLIGARATLQSA